MTRVVPAYLKNRGFSIGIGDVTPSATLEIEKDELIKNGYKKSSELIESYRNAMEDLKGPKLVANPGCSLAETLESKILGELSKIRETSAESCFNRLHSSNTPLNMAKSGAKGSNINISQMIACVGQQSVSGGRIPNGFEQRSLPHFVKNALAPDSRGFVKNSFYRRVFTGISDSGGKNAGFKVEMVVLGHFGVVFGSFLSRFWVKRSFLGKKGRF